MSVGFPGIGGGGQGAGGGGGGGGASLSNTQTFTGQNTFNLSPIVPYTNLAGGTTLAVDTYYYDSLSANRTLTFSGSPSNGDKIALDLIVTNSPTLTVPSSILEGSGSATPITSYSPVNGPQTLRWVYINAAWHLYGTSVAITGSGGSFVQSNGPQISGMTVVGGLTASGSTAIDFSGSNGAFKTSTGAVTLGGAVTLSSTINGNTITAGTGTLKLNSGTLVNGVTGALTETTGATTIDCSTSCAFSLTLNANLTTVTISNFSDGQTIVAAITNTASNFTVTWGNSIKWVGGTQPTQTVGAHADVWTLVKLGSTIYGSVVQNF